MQVFKKILILIGVLAVVVLIGLGSYLYWGSYADGYRVGTLLKLSRKGMVFKTWEGELSQGFLEQNPNEGGVATKIWYFSVPRENQEAITKLQQAMDHGWRVKLYYEEKYFVFPWLGETRHMVYRVDEVK